MPTNITFLIRLLIAICFLILSCCVLRYKSYTWLEDWQAYGFAGLLFIYGLFRIYRAIKRSDDIFAEK